MKVLDWESHGNLVRFFLGDDGLEKWWGDDWNDAPWDCNAGTVYSQFVTDHLDVAFDLDTVITVPGNEELNTVWCKNDMRNREVPILFLERSGWSAVSVFMGDSLEALLRIPGEFVFHRGYVVSA